MCKICSRDGLSADPWGLCKEKNDKETENEEEE